ncbi:hypothetical protein L9F63_028358, partial [Diploptera punctata]
QYRSMNFEVPSEQQLISKFIKPAPNGSWKDGVQWKSQIIYYQESVKINKNNTLECVGHCAVLRIHSTRRNIRYETINLCFFSGNNIRRNMRYKTISCCLFSG